MVKSIVELLFGLCWGALILLVGSSIVGSIVAALRGVSHESDYGREDAKQVAGVVAEVTGSEDRHQSDRVVQAVIKRPARSSGFLSYR